MELLNMEKIEQIQITRSFSRKVQVKQYEPIDYFASFQAVLREGATEKDVLEVSYQLNSLATKEVEKTIKSYYESNVAPF